MNKPKIKSKHPQESSKEYKRRKKTRLKYLRDHEASVLYDLGFSDEEPEIAKVVSGEGYSFPLFMKQWALIFKVSRNKMRELRDSNQYHFRQVSARKWSLPKHELPAEYLEKYRNITKS